MPSPDFMKAVLESDQARMARGEGLPAEMLPEEPQEDSEDLTEEPEDGEPDQRTEEEQGEKAEGEEEVTDDDTHDDEREAEEEPKAQEEFYLGRFKTREEAERGWEQTYRFGQEQARERAELEQRLSEAERRAAFLEGAVSARGGEEDTFEAWADAQIEQDAEQGMYAAIRHSIDTGDQSYAYEYTDRWAQVDPYLAARWANRLENQVFLQQRGEAGEPQQQQQQHPAQPVIEAVYQELAAENPEYQDPEMLRGIAEKLRSDELLRHSYLTGDPRTTRLAFEAALDATKRLRNGQRRVRTSDAEQVAREKRAATVATGDGAPQRRSSYPALTAEEESLLAGADKLGLKRREEQ